jgi:hypothetical protein
MALRKHLLATTGKSSSSLLSGSSCMKLNGECVPDVVRLRLASSASLFDEVTVVQSALTNNNYDGNIKQESNRRRQQQALSRISHNNIHFYKYKNFMTILQSSEPLFTEYALHFDTYAKPTVT